jgi:hypothetical protein
MYGDTQVIRCLARTLREQADEIRREADRLLSSAESVPWEGLAADTMRMHARSRTAALRHTAQLHDAAADALELHATEVERVKALIAAIEHRVRAMIAAARDRLAGVAGAIASGLGLSPDPVDQLLDRFVPPPSGHRDWLTIDLPGLP